MDYEQLAGRIEAVFFASAKSWQMKELVRFFSCSLEDIERGLAILRTRFAGSGLTLVHVGDVWELATNPAFSEDVRMLQESSLGELTKPSLETLTIIAYRGPLRQRDIEALRGVQCSLILRNLLMRNLVAVQGEGEAAFYSVTTEMLRLFGLECLQDLPEYERFHTDGRVDALLQRIFAPDGKSI